MAQLEYKFGVGDLVHLPHNKGIGMVQWVNTKGEVLVLALHTGDICTTYCNLSAKELQLIISRDEYLVLHKNNDTSPNQIIDEPPKVTLQHENSGLVLAVDGKPIPYKQKLTIHSEPNCVGEVTVRFSSAVLDLEESYEQD